jgi:CRP-like cAMP-binding protein
MRRRRRARYDADNAAAVIQITSASSLTRSSRHAIMAPQERAGMAVSAPIGTGETGETGETGGTDLLRRISLFESLGAAELSALATFLRRRRYAKGATIFFEGDPGGSLYIIQAGTVKISLNSPEGRELVLALLGPGDFFGDLALLDGDPHSADAVARDACDLVLLQRDAFLRFLADHPPAAAALLAVLSRRLRRNARMMQEAAFLDVPARLASAILQLSPQSANRNPDAQHATAELTQTELAGLVGTTRESVNKWLGVFERQGLLRRHGGRIIVLDGDELRRRIG